MKDFPTCFGENAVQVSEISCSRAPKVTQNIVTSVYRCELFRQPCTIIVTWCKNLVGLVLGIEMINSLSQYLCQLEIKPWLFSRRTGFKEMQVNCNSIAIYWDLNSAKFGSGPEPLEEFFFAVVFNGEIVFLIGDMRKEAYEKINSVPVLPEFTLISRREHIFGKKAHCTKAQFTRDGKYHDIKIRCFLTAPDDMRLLVCIDGKEVLQVKRLRWKFRGNKIIVVDSVPVEIFWDVYNWLFSASFGSAVFLFQTCPSPENSWTKQISCDPFLPPWRFSQEKTSTADEQDLSFSLTLYAWRNEQEFYIPLRQ